MLAVVAIVPGRFEVPTTMTPLSVVMTSPATYLRSFRPHQHSYRQQLLLI